MRSILFAAAAALLATGCEGPEGPAGTAGTAGTAGAAGVNGTDGTDGSSGSDGSDGSDGSNGADGSSGTDGLNAGDFTFRTDAAADYDQVDRVGMPVVSTAVITNKDLYNQSSPSADAAGDFVTEITANVAGLHTALDDDLDVFFTPCAVNPQNGEADCIGQAAPLVVPDTLKIDLLGISGFPNGRFLDEPVVDITFAVVLLDLTVHGVGTLAGLPLSQTENDVAFLGGFPYLAAPH